MSENQERAFDPANIPLFQGTFGEVAIPQTREPSDAPSVGPSIPKGAANSLRSLGRRAATPPELPSEEVNRTIEDFENTEFQDVHGEDSDDVFWTVVAMLRKDVAEKQSDELENKPAMSQAAKEELGRFHINQVVDDYISETERNSGQRGVWSTDYRTRIARAIFNDMFRLGRFQELIDDPEVENIHIHGFDQVFVDYGGGRVEKRGPIATSDEQLMEALQFFASRSGEESREFSSANPDLDMDLLGMVRLAALAPPIVKRPSAVLRIHRFVNITMERLVELRLLTPEMVRFIEAGVKARKTFVICGEGGDGKTTLMRAMSSLIDPMAQIVTIEKERELHLERLSNRVVPPFAIQYRPGIGEKDVNGRNPGEYTLESGFAKALRLNSQIILVGEVRGDEIVAMIQAMQAGRGTFSTTHADSPDDCIDRLASLGINVYGKDYMLEQLGRHIDFVIQLAQVPDGEKRRRKVTYISEVLPSDTGKVSTQDVYRLEPGDNFAKFIREPSGEKLRSDLIRAGLDFNTLGQGGAV